MAFARNFSAFAESFGKEITDNNLIQTFILLLQDSEPEVKLAAINNIVDCLTNLSTDKISNLILPTIQGSYADGSAQFRAGAATALCHMSTIVGKDSTTQKILPILIDLLKDDNAEVKLNVITNIIRVSNIVGQDFFGKDLLTILSGLTKDGQWRVRMSVFELIADLGVAFGKQTFSQHLYTIFMCYLSNTAASVRKMGIEKSEILAQEFNQDWIVNDYIHAVKDQLKVDKKGYNYRICCL